jgi:beta-mannosidase
VSLSVAPWSLGSTTLPGDVARLGDTGSEVLRAVAGDASAWWWPAVDRELRYPATSLRVGVEPVAAGRLEVRVEADVLVRDLAIMVDRLDPSAEIDRQLVSLLPGERATFAVTFGADSPMSPESVAVISRPLWWTANDLVPSG